MMSRLKTQYYYFDYLPVDVLRLILMGLCIADMLALTKTCTHYSHHHFFKSEINGRQLLSYVMQADEKAAEEHIIELAEQASNLWCIILNGVPGKEACGRPWKSVSPLQFAAWIGDYHMVNMLLSYVPEEGKQQAMAQLSHVKTAGLEHGKRMAPFRQLIETYTQIAATYESYVAWKDLLQYCIKEIGSMQNQLSCFGLQLFCNSKAFNQARNTFVECASPRLVTPNNSLGKPAYDTGLGETYFIYRYNLSQPVKVLEQIDNPFRDFRLGDLLEYEANTLKVICRHHKKQIDSEMMMLQLSLQSKIISNMK